MQTEQPKKRLALKPPTTPEAREKLKRGARNRRTADKLAPVVLDWVAPRPAK